MRTLQAIGFAGKGDKESALRDFERSLTFSPDSTIMEMPKQVRT